MRKLTAVIALLLVVVFQGGVRGQDVSSIENDIEAKEDNWRFSISPYALLASQATDVGGEQLRQSFNDLASMTNFGFQLIASIRYKKWILSGDGTYANLGSTTDSGALQIDLDIKQYMLDLRLGYLVYLDIDQADESDVIRGWALEVNAGAKYWRNDITLDYRIQVGDPPPQLEGNLVTTQDWWDPMLGVRARFILSRRVFLGVYASGGGFGIGDASKFSWDFIYVNTFKQI